MGSMRRYAEVLLLLTAAASWARALTPDRRLTQYGHTAWRTPEAFAGTPLALAQTNDGYLWVGTDQGLLRFDGVRFLSLPLFAKYPALRSRVGALRADRDGGLWIAAGNLFYLKGDVIREYPSGAGGINKIIQDHAGVIWVTRYRVHDHRGPLCRIAGTQLTCYGPKDGILGSYAVALAEDPEGYMWVGSYFVCRWKPGSSTRYLEKEFASSQGSPAVRDLFASGQQVWLASEEKGRKRGVQVFSLSGPDSGHWNRFSAGEFDGTQVAATSLFIDSHGSLWVGERTNGIDRIVDGRAEHFGSADGLSSDVIGDFLEDREGDLWVLTDGGLDRFRDTAVVKYSVREGLGAANVDALLAARDGSVWVAGQGSLDVIRGLDITNLPSKVRHTGGIEYYALLQDAADRVWIGSSAGMFQRSGTNLAESLVASKPGTIGEAAESITQDVGGDVWVLTYGSNFDHLYRVSKGDGQPELVALPKAFEPRQVEASPKGGIWMLSTGAELARSVGNRIERVSGGKGRAAAGNIGMYVDGDDSIWIATREGVIWWDGHADHVLDQRSGLPCNFARAVIRDAERNLWVSSLCGFVSIAASEIERWQRVPSSVVKVRLLDALDGAHSGTPSEFPRASLGPDGRLWFTDGLSVQRVDPRSPATNKTPPPVYIEELTADQKGYPLNRVASLPPRTRDVRITYTALSFPLPQKVQFRYKLEGHDTQWQEAGTRREAFYTDLAPGDYTFRVVACNNSGIWNEAGARLPFRVQAAWYQTRWFFLLAVILGAACTWLLYRLRLNQVAAGLSARFDERLSERTRLARDLHDTLLQTIQGSKMVADDALEGTAGPVEMRTALERLAKWLGQAVEEGREALHSLRLSTTETNNLADGLRRALEESAAGHSGEIAFDVKGAYREMHPILRDEIFRIGNEAIRNACTHSQASRIEVELQYGQNLCLSVLDNGIGMEQETAAKGKASHFGLQGMRERAARIRGKLQVTSAPGQGTEVRLEVPGDVVFRNAPRKRSAGKGRDIT